jgi:5-methylcytosine-specific restriction endonuclease McrA
VGPVYTDQTESSGKLHRLCPACDAREAERNVATTLARSRGYVDAGNTPEYKRMQREREAAKQGRVLPDYIPQAEKERRATLLRADGEAHRIRRRYFGKLLLEWNQIVLTSPDIVDEDRATAAAQYRAFYALNSQREVERHMAWKAANPERVLQHEEVRTDRIKAGSDGTLTTPVVRALKAAARRCAYCDEPFLVARDKQTDHMIAVCHGTEHSRRNVVIVCRRCNGKKASLTYGDWLDRIAPQHRGRAIALFNQRYGLGAVARPEGQVASMLDLVAGGATGAPGASAVGV